MVRPVAGMALAVMVRVKVTVLVLVLRALVLETNDVLFMLPELSALAYALGCMAATALLCMRNAKQTRRMVVSFCSGNFTVTLAGMDFFARREMGEL